MNKSIIKVILVAIPLLAAVPAMAQFDNAFQSTSTMVGSGSTYASDPTMGANGMATYDGAIPNRGRTEGHDFIDEVGDDGKCDVCGKTESQHNVGTDTGDTTGGNQLPIGPALPALLLLAGAYAGVVAVKRRRQQA